MQNKYNLIEERADSVCEPLENVLFVRANRPDLGKRKPSEILPLLNYVAKVNRYNLNNQIDYICAKIALENSIFLS